MVSVSKTLEIITGKDNPVLRATSKPVNKVTKDIKKLVDRMQETVRIAKGVGIAAPQVGQNVRIFIAQISDTFLTFINPEITDFSEATEIGEEGCLSLPGQWGNVERAKDITVQFEDEKGRVQKLNLSKMDARVVQHELDHLDGILFLDRIEN